MGCGAMFPGLKKGHSLPQPKKKPKRHKRLTPLRERAERAGVLDRFKVTPPGLRERAEGGSVPAKKEIQALQKHNHQVVDRAEVAAAPDQLKHWTRLDSDARSHRKRGGLGSLVPDLVLGPRKPLDIGELQQPGRRDTTRFFGTGSRVPMDWAASAIKPGRQSLNRTSMDRRRGQSGYCPNRHATRPRCDHPTHAL